jgi:hypothetical protein
MNDKFRFFLIMFDIGLLLTTDNVFLRLLAFVAIVLMIIAICLEHGLIAI